MIHVTQGHEQGIGLEVFFKSLISLPSREHSKFILYGSKQYIDDTLESIKLAHSWRNNSLHLKNSEINCILLEENELTLSNYSLLKALENIKKNEILFTLPTSKDQLFLDGEYPLGYTEFLRKYFKNPNLLMHFHSEDLDLSLLSDHIPLKQVPSYLTQERVLEKLSILVNSPFNFKRFVIAGINPHAGENGLLGNEEKTLNSSLEKIRLQHPSFEWLGPLPGDTLHQYQRDKTCIVSTYHDQGLSYFKSKKKFLGINITLGLPFLRASVDHGTAFELYGKNKANYLGCYYCLRTLLTLC
ncbi:MAG: 4-hydroxythreonine-4-phosphate dehydrogenase PdxA [Halobacteriovoraceae bacterium]|nr:4-hydroxythreonine-4-phosphate dehydrogenase PdxA [Halobacteriovoraceae bacterium]